MTYPQGDLRLLETDLARRLLASTIPARLAFVWTDGTPRVMPTWFQWSDGAIVMVTYLGGSDAGIRHAARRVEVLRANPAVAITIDTETFPPEVLLVRGRAEIDEVDGVAPEYVQAAHRYLGPDGGAQLITSVDQPGTRQARIKVRPTWAGLLDFQTRMPGPQGGVVG
jgi:nitroimidazol reductase NimA-like FMN-containing flavoprotein (pyridoxamine 5'-phosphate oxidase superfamily)